jgi:hypothetical protein
MLFRYFYQRFGYLAQYAFHREVIRCRIFGHSHRLGRRTEVHDADGFFYLTQDSDLYQIKCDVNIWTKINLEESYITTPKECAE